MRPTPARASSSITKPPSLRSRQHIHSSFAAPDSLLVTTRFHCAHSGPSSASCRRKQRQYIVFPDFICVVDCSPVDIENRDIFRNQVQSPEDIVFFYRRRKGKNLLFPPAVPQHGKQFNADVQFISAPVSLWFRRSVRRLHPSRVPYSIAAAWFSDR